MGKGWAYGKPITAEKDSKHFSPPAHHHRMNPYLPSIKPYVNPCHPVDLPAAKEWQSFAHLPFVFPSNGCNTLKLYHVYSALPLASLLRRINIGGI
jgi:hypothetical protein